MFSRVIKTILLVCLALFFCTENTKAQCFASPGNPVGGAENMGVMSKNYLRIMSFYRYHQADKYYKKDAPYKGMMETVDKAFFNYCGFIVGYGITDRLSMETEMGYFLNKTQIYLSNEDVLRGFGFSNINAGLKYALYQNSDKRLEWTVAAAGKVPLSNEFQRVNGVELPVDLQPSTASYGFVLQSYLIKENSFDAWRVFLINRFEKNYENPNKYLFGNSVSTSAFFSKHYIFGNGSLKDWTIILQARHQFQEKNIRNGKTVDASGSHIVFLAPQLNCSIKEKWNLSLMFEKAVYRYYNEVQLGADYSVSFHLSRDINLIKQKKS
jgi:hypothetical protein